LSPTSRSHSNLKDFGLLNEARDWVCDFDLPELHVSSTYYFPHDVEISDVRCDGYIISRAAKRCIILELTVPMEENIEYWHTEKLNKYIKLAPPNWKIDFFILEIGCRGFIPSRYFSMVRNIGFTNSEAKVLYNNVQLIARKCSYVIGLIGIIKIFNSLELLILRRILPS